MRSRSIVSGVLVGVLVVGVCLGAANRALSPRRTPSNAGATIDIAEHLDGREARTLRVGVGEAEHALMARLLDDAARGGGVVSFASYAPGLTVSGAFADVNFLEDAVVVSTRRRADDRWGQRVRSRAPADAALEQEVLRLLDGGAVGSE